MRDIWIHIGYGMRVAGSDSVRSRDKPVNPATATVYGRLLWDRLARTRDPDSDSVRSRDKLEGDGSGHMCGAGSDSVIKGLGGDIRRAKW